MNGEESLTLLREIKDILNDQTKLVTEQHADNAKKFRAQQILGWIFVIEVFVLGVAWFFKPK
jgi:heme oxygenase